MAPKKYLPFLAAVLVVLVFILILAFHLGGSGDGGTAALDPSAVQEGVDYLKQLEAQDPAQIDQIRKQLQQQKIQELRDERLRQLESGEISVWSLFNDYVLLGDSRATGFELYGFLPEDRVIAENGATLRYLDEHISDVVAMNPSNIFLCFGLNDIASGIWSTAESYVEEYQSVLERLIQTVPDAKIFVSSTLPAREPAFTSLPVLINISSYNSAVEDMCSQLPNCYYVNNDAAAAQYADLWEDDGIHVSRDFYPHWAVNMILELYSSTLDDAAANDEI